MHLKSNSVYTTLKESGLKESSIQLLKKLRQSSVGLLNL